ncbi:VOC family protein [Larkinella insperata]|uniref:VOC family protein n=1 Tax=Larkinella insperata TaxID=332158 RepID=A0ABW3QFU7_9BACT|nr:VOC family protein [Larkinella insperata]
MQQRISVITLAADDLPAMRQFYVETLGWEPVAENQDILFIKCNGFLFSICKKEQLAPLIGVKPDGTGFRAFTISYNVPTRAEVDEWFAKLKARKVALYQEPTEAFFGGYFFYFSDVEGNVLEIAYNPYIPLDEAGNALTHNSIADL